MISLNNLKKRDDRGFTIVELLIVIVVIGILALLVITTYGGIQQKARNSKRQDDVANLQKSLEAFYSDNSYYPSLSDLNTKATRDSKMKNLDSQVLVDPSSQCNPDSASCLVSSGASSLSGSNKKYQYTPLNSSGASCESDDTTCSQYTLTSYYEGTVNGQTSFTKKGSN